MPHDWLIVIGLVIVYIILSTFNYLLIWLGRKEETNEQN